MNKSDNKKALIALILAAIVGGGIPVLGKIGLTVIPPFTFTFLRFFIAALFIVPIFLMNRPKIDRELLKVLSVSLLASVNVTLFAFGVRLTTATISQMLYAVVPMVTVVFSYFLLKEKVTRKKLFGVCLGFLGVLLIILLPAIGKSSPFKGNMLGNIIIFIAVFIFTLYSVLSKRFQSKYTPIQLTTFLALTTIVVMLPVAFLEFKTSHAWVNHLSVGILFSVLYIGLFGGFLYYLLYQYAIKHGTPIIASMTMFLQPVATFIWAFLLLGERLTYGLIIGAILALSGAWITTVAKSKK